MRLHRTAIVVGLAVCMLAGAMAFDAGGGKAVANSIGGNGLFVVSKSDDNPEFDWYTDLYVVDPSTGVESNLTDRVGQQLYPSWSPDGRWLAYQSSSSGAIYAITPDGRRERVLRPDPGRYGQVMYPTWSSDGTKLAYIELVFKKDAPRLIKVWDLVSGNVEVVATVKHWVSHPEWSPDGRKIVFMVERQDEQDNARPTDIRILNLGSRRVVNLSRSLRDQGLTSGHSYPDWTVDGRIVFRTPYECLEEYQPGLCGIIFMVRPDGSGLKQVTTSPRDWTGDGMVDEVYEAVPSPDGTKLALLLYSQVRAKEEAPFEVWTLDLANGEMSKIVDDVYFPGFDWQPRCTIVGTRRGDVLRGTPGRDLICGLGGDDVIYGRGGNDSVFGHHGDDRMVGGLGRDIVVGNAGRDTCDRDESDFSRVC